MSTQPRLTTGADPFAHLLDVWKWVGTIFFGGFLGVVGFSLGGPLAGGAVVVIVFLLMMVRPLIRQMTVSFEFYDEKAVANYLVGGSEVRYEDVAFGVRSEGSGDKKRGTADFEFVRANKGNVTFDNVVDPDRVEEHLNEYLPSAGEWMRNHEEEDTAVWAIQRHRWYHDFYEDLETEEPPFEEHPGDRPEFVDSADIEPDLQNGSDILTSEDFKELTGVSAEMANLEVLDDVDGVNDISDIDPSDFSGTDDGGADGGDGFDGGGGE